jgi:hypothetical protein
MTCTRFGRDQGFGKCMDAFPDGYQMVGNWPRALSGMAGLGPYNLVVSAQATPAKVYARFAVVRRA